MTRARKRLLWAVLLCVPAILIGAPFLRADMFEAHLRRALERSLGRPVAIHEGVRYLAFPTPGLTARKVEIAEDPRFGLEPFAYVESLDARVSLWRSLKNRRLEVGTVRMDEASVNLARQEGAGWNLATLLSEITTHMKDGAPDLLLRGARINFRNGLLKSPYYLNTVDLDLKLSSESFEWSYEASPARTDRSEQGFGRLTGGGRWSPAAGIDLEVELERSSTSEVVTLLAGRELNVRGRIASRARLTGPLEAARLTGFLRLEGIERGSLFSGRGPVLGLAYEGTLNVAGQTLALSTAPNEKEPPPVRFEFSVERLMTDPRWKASLRFEDLNPQDVLTVWKRFGAQVPDDLTLAGRMNGELHLAPDQPAEGRIELLEATVKIGADLEAPVDKAEMKLTGPEIVLSPLTWKRDGGEAEISGAWAVASDAAHLGLKLRSLAAADLNVLLARLPRSSPAGFFGPLEGGKVSGSLALRRRDDGTGAWTGDFELAGTAVPLPGLDQPVRIESASVSLNGSDFAVRKLKARLGDQSWEGSLSRTAASPRPLHFRLATEEMTAAEFERLAGLSLPGSRGFFARTLRRDPQAPAWLKERRAEGELRIGELQAGTAAFSQITAHVYWDAQRLDMPRLEGRWQEGRFSGRAELRAGAPPAYVVLGRLEGAQWKGARFDAEIDVRAAGLTGEWRGEGSFQARGVPAGEDILRLVSGCWDLASDRTTLRARLRCLDIHAGGETLTGSAQTTTDGNWTGELTGPRRTRRLSGTLHPLQFDLSGN